MSGVFDDLTELGDVRAAVEAWEQAPILLTVAEGEQMQVLAVNAFGRRLVGGSFAVGSSMLDVAADLSGGRLALRMQEVFRTGEPYSTHEWRMPVPRPDGTVEELFIDFTYSPWRRTDGSVQGVIATAVDVTESVRTRRRAEERSAEWEQRFASSQAAMSSLQGALLPAEVPVLPGLQVGARYLLADADTAAGGDWFDAVPLPDGRVALVVGDVVGHGITASAVMGQLRALLSQRLADGEDLAAVLTALDRAAHRIDGAAMTTVCAAVLDPASGRVEYCTAGHPPPLVLDGADWRYLPTTGAGPLTSGAGFATGTAELPEGGLLLLYTDGLVERPGRAPDQSTVEIGQAVSDAFAGRPMLAGAATHPPDRVCEQGLELLTRVTGYADDITLLAARRVPAPAPLAVEVHADVAAAWTVAAELERWLAAVDAGQDDQMSLRHAVVELVSNTVEHAYRDRPPGTVALRADLDRTGSVVLTLTDDGRWRDPAESGRETSAAGDPRVRGLGLSLVQAVVDEFALDSAEHGTTARVRRRLRRPAPLLTEAPGGAGRRAAAELGDQLEITPAGPDRFAVRGPLHLGTVATLDGLLSLRARGGTRSLTLDLSGLTHLASAGVQLLQEARQAAQAHGADLALLAAPGSVAEHVLTLVAVAHTSDVPTSPADPSWP